MTLNIEHFKKLADDGMAEIFKNVPYAENFHCAEHFDIEYYKRHMVECVLRIDMNNQLDSKAITTIVSSNEPAAKELSYYLYDELNHGTLFLADLKSLGMSENEVLSNGTFHSTKLLMGYLNLMVEEHGALPAIVWDWFLEYYSDLYNGHITSKATANIGRRNTKGAASHLNTDEVEDHVGLMFGLVKKVVRNEEEHKVATEVLKRCIELVGMYFSELYESTIKQNQETA